MHILKEKDTPGPHDETKVRKHTSGSPAKRQATGEKHVDAATAVERMQHRCGGDR